MRATTKELCKEIYYIVRYAALRMFCRRRTPRYLGEVVSVCAIRIDRIGDLVVSLPAVKALRQAYPRSTIAVLVSEGLAALMKCVPFVDEVIVYTGFMKTVRYLRKKKYDVVIDLLMDYPITPALLAHASGAPFTAGFDVGRRGFCFNFPFRPDPAKKYVGDYMMDLVKAMLKGRLSDPSVNESAYEIFSITAGERMYAKTLLEGRGVKGQGPVIGIHPGAYYRSQCWPPRKFSELADRIIERHGAHAVIIGSRREKSLVETVQKAMRSPSIDIVGLPLDKLAALIAMLNVFVCNNSGPLHIAAALKVPTVSTMGPTDPLLWHPRGEHNIVMRTEVGCSPCGKARCMVPLCMELITVDDMMNAVEQLMKGRFIWPG